MNMTQSYWNKKGTYQEFIPQLDVTIPKDTADGKMYEAIKLFYYRRHNDGDKTYPCARTFNDIARRMNKKGLAKVSLSAKINDRTLELYMDWVINFLITRHLKKQVTVVVQVAYVFEVPVTFDKEDIDEVMRHESAMDIEFTNPNVNLVEVSEVLAINSIVEAKL